MLSDNEFHYYKIKLTKGGDLRIDLTSACQATFLYLYDENGSELSFSKAKSKITQGSLKTNYHYEDANGRDKTGFYWNEEEEQFKGKILFEDLDKGTYYLCLVKGGYNKWDHDSAYSGQGKAKIKLTFPGKSKEENAEEKSETAPMLNITLKKGEALPLSVSDADGGISWTSSDKTVAATDKDGKITAKKAGTAVITAKAGKSALQIKITVE